MARPRGFRLNPHALNDILVAKRLTLTECAALADMPLTTLSGLTKGNHAASMKTVRTLSSGLGCAAETLFPELAFPDLREAALAMTVAA